MFLSIGIVSTGPLASTPYVRAVSALAQNVTTAAPNELGSNAALKRAELVLVDARGASDASLATLRRLCPSVPIVGVVISDGADDAKRGSGDTRFARVLQVATPSALTSALRSLRSESVIAPAAAVVLVIDDDEPMRSLAEELLEDAGYKVITAESGAKGLEAMRSATIDIALVDMRMPGMNGAEVCRRIRAEPTTADLPVLIVSGVDALGEKLTAFDAGANDFISKPYVEEDMIEKVVRLLKMAESRQMADRVRRPVRK